MMGFANNNMTQNTETVKTISHQDFWDKVACDYYRGIDIAVDAFQLEKNIVMAFAIIECQNEDHYRRFKIDGNEFGYSFTVSKGLKSLRDRRFQILLSIGLPLLIIGLAVWSWTNLTNQRANQVIVSRVGGLKTYQKVSAGDLADLNGPEDPKAVPFIGRYVLTDIPNDTVLSEKNLLSADLSAMMSGRVLFSLPAKSEYIDSAIRANSKIGIMLAKSEGAPEAAIIIHDIILVGLEKKGESAILVMGLNADQLALIKNAPPTPNIFVIRN